jgi:hypothetical protein
MRGSAVRAALVLLAVGATVTAVAAPLTVEQPFLQVLSIGTNTLGFLPGDYIRFGANSVVPNGDSGTTGLATFFNTSNNQTITRQINFTPNPFVPNFFTRSIPYEDRFVVPWTISFSNNTGGTTDAFSELLSFPSGTFRLPVVHSISMSGSSVFPTFTWTPPSFVNPDGYRVNIFDRAFPGSTGQVLSRNLTGTSYTVNPADFTVPGHAFALGKHYSIEISMMKTRDGTANLINANVYVMSRVFADFTPVESDVPAISLPLATVEGDYQFNVQVEPGNIYYLDPPIAVGYVFQTGTGDPNFRAVTLPAGIGDSKYDVHGYDGAGDPSVLLAKDLAGGVTHDFGAAGVSKFQVTGIETSANLDPASTTAFIAALTFTGPGQFTGSQTPIVVDVPAVPEPQTYVMLACGLLLMLGIGAFRCTG